MIYGEFLNNLNARGMFRIHPRLDRIRKVLSLLGNPQDRVPSIHIAGTNGKGSVAAALESVLRASGYRTGLYTSPHLVDLRERVKMNGTPLTKGFIRITEEVLDAERRAKVPLTYFELLTAIAFHSFAAKKVDVAIVECGLGGLWDATNVITNPLMSIITSIGLDHREWLGKDEVLIASQKAGIMKSGGFVISGARGPGRNVIQRIAREKRATLEQIDTTFSSFPLTTSWQAGKQTIRFLYKGERREIVPFGLLGKHQVDNIAVVMAAIRRLKQLGWDIPDARRDQGLAGIDWPGRLQLIRLSQSAPIILDGAHNPPAMRSLLESIKSSRFKKVQKTFVFSAFKDKDYAAMAAMIAPVAAEVCLCPLQNPRGAALHQLRSAFVPVRIPIHLFKSAQEALENALKDTPRDGVVIVTGSLALVGGILLRHKKVPAKEFIHA